MSYEGYTQHLCERGHLHISDDGVCPTCGALAAWGNPVDETNSDQYGIILNWSSLERGQEDGVKVYDIPCEGGPRVPPRHYWDATAMRYLPLPEPT